MFNWKDKYLTKDKTFFINYAKSTYAIRVSDKHEVFIKKFNQKDNPSDSQVFSVLKHLYKNNHDNIVDILDILEVKEDKFSYIVMEKYNNNLKEQINRNKHVFDIEQIMYFLKQIIKGYRHLMNFGIFHRYLDPKNIYYVGNNKDIIYKIGGFGHSKFLDDQDSLGEECTKQQNWGYYQAPEQQEIKYSYKSDLFSLGLILHEMATKQQLKSKKELETKKLDLCDLNIDDFLKNLLLQMIVFKPQQRLSWSQLIIRMFYKSIKLEHQNEITISLERKQNCFIKIIKKPIKNYEICLEERAKSEMEINRVLQRNENKNIVKIYDLLHEPDSSEIYIIMEKCEGSLADLLEKKKFNIKEILDLVSQINDGYEFLQQEKIMHRDIKPENILYKTVEKQIEYKIADFGISCKAEQAYSKCGTTPYKAPEVKGDFQYYNKCDIYSLGILICYVAQKKYPFDPNKLSSFFVLLRDKKTIEHCYPSDTVLDDKIKQLINRMIVYEAKDRVAWGSDLKNLIQQIQEQLPKEQVIFKQINNFNQFPITTQNTPLLNNNNNNFRFPIQPKSDICFRNTEFPRSISTADRPTNQITPKSNSDNHQYGSIIGCKNYTLQNQIQERDQINKHIFIWQIPQQNQQTQNNQFVQKPQLIQNLQVQQNQQMLNKNYSMIDNQAQVNIQQKLFRWNQPKKQFP